MKSLLVLASILTANMAFASVEVIYGEDNRKDSYQVSSALHLGLAQSSAAMIPLSKFDTTDTAGVFQLKNVPTMEEGQNICPSESFSQQLTAATCSGFLVGPDLLVTAGHCYKSFDLPENVCKNFAWVFNYKMDSENHDPTKAISSKDVYLCKQVVVATLDASRDFAIIKLNRAVAGRSPANIRTSGKVADNAKLLVVGHPSGLPQKIADGGRITRNIDPTRFSTTLDTFHGNSGSAVYDAETGLVEGILIQGRNDYVPSIPGNHMSCMVVNRCSDTASNCQGGVEFGPVASGEVVLRIGSIGAELASALRQ
jgi:V8-like Glu-specific endopeptidase